MTRPITHRVTPPVADAWIANAVWPPGRGFEEVLRADKRERRAWIVAKVLAGAIALVTLWWGVWAFVGAVGGP